MSEIKEILSEHFARYPAMQPRDAIKLVYQHTFGGEHLVTDEIAALNRLTVELGQLTYGAHVPLSEPIGNGLCRLQLRAVPQQIMPPDILNRLFIQGTRPIKGDRDGFSKKLGQLREMAGKGAAPFATRDFDQYLKEYEKAGCPVVSHSGIYRRYYHPAYRVMPDRIVSFWPLFWAISRLLQRKDRVVLGLDGMAAAGKTTLAALLSEVYSGAVIHMDDFFLPGELRTPDRLSQPGGNVHYERFKAEVSPHLRENEAFSYAPFDCHAMAYAPLVTVSPSRLMVVEGAYSLHPALGIDFDLKVFLTVPEQEQMSRILTRNGAGMAGQFQKQWIPMERAYAEAYRIPESCGLVF